MSDELVPGAGGRACRHAARASMWSEDYAATGLSLKAHPVRFFRDRLTRRGVMRNAEHRSADLPPNSSVTVAGLVLVRQMPGLPRASSS